MSKSSVAEGVLGCSSYGSVDQLLDAFHAAASKADLAAYFGCFDKTGRFLGTDATENWSATEFYSFCKPHFARGNGWTYTPMAGSRKVTHYNHTDGRPNFCTFDEILLNDGFGTCRGTGSLLYNQASSCWLVAAYHLSFPVPNDIAHDITSTIKSADPTLKAKLADQAAADLLAELELEDEPKKEKAKSGKKKKGK